LSIKPRNIRRGIVGTVVLCLGGLVTAAVLPPPPRPAPSAVPYQSQSSAAPALPMPAFHHIHLHSVNPDASIAWYQQYWPKGRRTTFGGFPAFQDELFLLYTKVAKQAPGAFDRKAERSVPQSAFWTFGSTFAGPNTEVARARFATLDPKQFQYVPLYGGPDGKQTALHALDLPMGDQLLTRTAIRERAEREKKAPPRTPPSSALDFFYFVDPDGMLVEVTAGKADSFWNHTHMWHEKPLCAANWYAEHLGMQIPGNAQALKEGRWEPCDAPIGEVSYPTFMRQGQLRIPIGTVRFANGVFPAYPRQCRDGRCGPGNDQPLTRSRGQVIDHLGFSYPDLDAVIAHLKSRNVPILEGPYTLGDTRAILIEDLDGLALELIEARK
jgi:catechol 2,3-dioxygenase-like lactoylglutathione lyase family enzyme